MGNIYERGGVPPSEWERLKKWGYPNHLSISRIRGFEATGILRRPYSFLDVGAGPNQILGLWVRSKGGRYMAFDRNAFPLEKQEEAGNQTIQGSIQEGIIAPNGRAEAGQRYDVTHARFLLMHLSQEHRKAAVREMLRVTRTAALFMDWNWNTIGGSPLANSFRDFGMDLLQASGGNPSMGSFAFQGEIMSTAQQHGFRARRFTHLRNTGDYGEMKDLLANTMIPSMSTHAPLYEPVWAHRLETAQKLLARVQAEMAKERPAPFTTASIGVVEAIRG